MRQHKRIRIRRFVNGKWWEYHTVATKIITYKFKDAKHVSSAVKGGFLPSKITKEGQLSYKLPFAVAILMDEKVKWRGEWSIDMVTGFYPVKPFFGG